MENLDTGNTGFTRQKNTTQRTKIIIFRVRFFLNYVVEEKFEDTKEIIRSP